MRNWHTRLNETLKAKGWCAAELQRRSGLPYESIKKWQAGDVDNPTGNVLKVLADALGVDEFWLMTGQSRAVENVEDTQLNQDVPLDYIKWIKDGLAASGKSQAALARHLEVAPARISELLHGKRKLQLNEVRSIQAFLGVTVPIGLSPAPPTSYGVKFMGSVGSSQWHESDTVFTDPRAFIAPYLDPRYPTESQSIFRIDAPSHDGRLTEGDYVTVVPFGQFRSDPIAEDLIVCGRKKQNLKQFVLREAKRSTKGDVHLEPLLSGDKNQSKTQSIEPLFLVVVITKPTT